MSFVHDTSRSAYDSAVSEMQRYASQSQDLLRELEPSSSDARSKLRAVAHELFNDQSEQQVRDIETLSSSIRGLGRRTVGNISSAHPKSEFSRAEKSLRTIYDILRGKQSPYEGFVSEAQRQASIGRVINKFQYQEASLNGNEGFRFVIPEGKSVLDCINALAARAWKLGDSTVHLNRETKNWLNKHANNYSYAGKEVFFGNADKASLNQDVSRKLTELKEAGLQFPEPELFILGYFVRKLCANRNLLQGCSVQMKDGLAIQGGQHGLEFIHGTRANFRSISIGMALSEGKSNTQS